MAVTEEQKLERYDLLCRALQAQSEDNSLAAATEQYLSKLIQIVRQDLLALARRASPHDFAEIYLEFEQELKRLKEFFAYPDLAAKTIVAVGGSFSAGKSSLINALLGESLMVVEVDPTTALPAYVLLGEQDIIYALNQHDLRIELSDDEFSSLTHDEMAIYGSQVSRALNTVFVVRKNFKWNNLAFIDTPGYSGQTKAYDRTDAKIATVQLNGAHAVVWVVNAKQGVIPESDLEFLSKINPDIPRLIIVSRADQINDEDLSAIVERIKTTLAERNLPVLDVLPASAHPKHRESLEPVLQQLSVWNQNSKGQTFNARFKELFTRYMNAIKHKKVQALAQSEKAIKLMGIDNSDLMHHAEDLHHLASKRLRVINEVIEELTEINEAFFKLLSEAGKIININLDEQEVANMEHTAKSNLSSIIASLLEKK